MKKNLVVLYLAAIMLGACQKKVDSIISSISSKAAVVKAQQFIKYTIPKGEQYCDISSYKAVSYQQLSFVVRFDSSAIYQTVVPSNQTDINKLFGFSDNNAHHHVYSA
ncbi:MAG: hypothetical protein M3040_16575, partial [Bacteroidota bacterium]|nr:hypothetical protein [Bacteroidota bacterium]